METLTTSPEKDAVLRRYKTTNWILIAIIIVLIGLLIFTANRVNTVIIDRDQTELRKQELQEELNVLVAEHEKIKAEYGEISEKLNEKDSIIFAQAEEIQTLINFKGNYYTTKKKLDMLRNITQGYVHQIDSLYRVAEELRDENLKIRKNYTAEKTKTEELTKVKEAQEKKIELASTLQAYNVVAVGIRTKGGGREEVITDKARRIEKVKVCFTLSENLIIEPGEKTIYIRIARPDNKIITEGDADIYTFMHEAKKIQYSMKKTINYQNKSMNLCLYWIKKDDTIPAMTGTYHVAVFCNDYEIGQSSFILE